MPTLFLSRSLSFDANCQSVCVCVRLCHYARCLLSSSFSKRQTTKIVEKISKSQSTNTQSTVTNGGSTSLILNRTAWYIAFKPVYVDGICRVYFVIQLQFNQHKSRCCTFYTAVDNDVIHWLCLGSSCSISNNNYVRGGIVYIYWKFKRQ